MVCYSCPRKCGVDRSKNKGFCGVGDGFVVARAAAHMWEEPCISGKNGSGTVFFSGCNLRCAYCQNFEISHGCFGKQISDKNLTEIFDRLIESGVHNINLVNPTHYAKRLARVLSQYHCTVPVVYNSSGYESVETLKMLEGLVDVYLPDLKYIQSDRAEKYSRAPDYFTHASKAIIEMKRQMPQNVFADNGIMKRGMIVRHLVLPKNTNQSLKILDWISENLGNETIISLMAQYTPCGQLEKIPELQRKITKREYDKVLSYLEKLGFENAFIQQLDAADGQFTPPFDLTGI